jgi:hypothetical protein
LHFGFGEVGRVSSRTHMTPSIHPVTGRTVVDVAVIEPIGCIPGFMHTPLRVTGVLSGPPPSVILGLGFRGQVNIAARRHAQLRWSCSGRLPIALAACAARRCLR